MNKNLTIIAHAFAKDMAHRYGIPELLTKRFTTADDNIAGQFGKSTVIAKIDNIEPVGLLGAILESLSATIMVTPDPEAKHVYHGNVRFRYACNGGEVGVVTTDFYISVEAHVGDVGMDESYIDAIDKNAFQIVRMHIYYEPAKKIK